MDTRVMNALSQGLKGMTLSFHGIGPDSVTSSWMENFAGMIYSGDVDMACNFLMGQRFSRKLGLKVFGNISG